MQLRNYQETAVNNVAMKLASGKRKVVFQLATGGGKTITFAAISQRFVEKNDKAVLILVDRIELLQQTRKTLWNAFGISAQIIIAGMRYIRPAKVYIGMIESTMKRLKKFNNEIGLVIIDEAHTHTFNKIHDHFPDQYILGFTATPQSADKKKPMKNYYEDIVCGVDIPELIQGGFLCQNITFAPRDTVDRASLTIKNGEFDISGMSKTFSASRYVNNTVKAYERWAANTKAVIFNVSIEHSIDVNNAFRLAGYDARALDSTMSTTERRNILKWFANTPGAILNNVGITTKGFDEPSIETVIVNKCTTSMPLWLQMTGRGSRPTETKSAFTIIDMGGNALTHGDWCDSRDWENIFFNPPKPRKKEGVAPVKYCPMCDAIQPSSARECSECGYVFPSKEKATEEMLGEFVVITKGIDVQEILQKNKHKKEFFTFFNIGKQLADQAKKTIPVMTDEIAEYILGRYVELAKEWCEIRGKQFIKWHYERAQESLYEQLAAKYKKWSNPLLEVVN